MKLSEKQIKILRDSWIKVVIYVEKLGYIFYTKLFEKAPEVKALFKGDIAAQERKIIHTVAVMITKLDKLDALKQELKALATRHIKYGVKPEYFNAFKQAFMAMLKEALKKQWNAETEDAWQTLLNIIAAAMIEDIQTIEITKAPLKGIKIQV